MRNSFITIISCLILICYSCQSTENQAKKIHAFSTSLSSTNIKLRGTLMLFGEYKGDLTRLTFKEYVNILKKNETHSSKGLAESVQNANDHYFIAKKNTFFVVLYLKKYNVVLFDDASTPGSDSIKILKKNENIPILAKFHKRLNQ